MDPQLQERFPAVARLGQRARRRRIEFVSQLGTMDCGAAALAMVLGYHGVPTPLADIENVLPMGRDGATAAALLEAARKFGLYGRGVQLDMEQIGDLPRASILYWGFHHFVVFDRTRSESVEIVDPAVGRRAIPIRDFRRAFTGVALVFDAPALARAGRRRRTHLASLYSYIADERGILGRVIATSIVAQFLTASLPLMLGIVVDRVIPRRDYSMLVALAIGYCVLQTFGAVAGLVRAHLLNYLRTRLAATLTLKFIGHLVALPYTFFQTHSSGDLLMRLGSNSAVRDIMTATALTALVDGTMAMTYLLILLMTHVHLTGVVLLLAGVRVGLLVAVRKRQRQLLAESVQNQTESQTLQVELLAGMETLKGMGLETTAAERWSSVFVDGQNISMRQGQLDATFTALLSVVSLITTLSLTFYGGFLVLQDTLTLGGMMAFNALAGSLFLPLNNLVSGGLQVQMLEVYAERMNDVLEMPTEQEAVSGRRTSILGSISFENVSFKYPGQDASVLERVSFHLPAGSAIAIVGRTGCGKSTLARLIAGLYVPASGQVLIDGHDLRSLDLRSVRRQLGVVTQDAQLFGGSIRRNIALAHPDLPLDRVIAVARIADIHEEVMAMPMGYDTVLSDRGQSVSGGQRQRLAIARALVREPKILILDEATSHLDLATEERIIRHLRALSCTRVIIAHRLSTIRDAELIIVLDGGIVREMGTHEHLLSLRGAYASLVSASDDGAQSATPIWRTATH